MLRDILLYATRAETGAQARLDAANRAMDRLERGVTGLDALSARYLREEIRQLRSTHPGYLLFEYLAQENQAFLFTEFVADIERHGLRYLCDTEMATGFPASLGSEAEQALGDLDHGNDVEQWMDFIGNRNFRRSVLCRDDAHTVSEPSLDVFADLTFAADLAPPAKLDLRREKPAPFSRVDGTRVMISHPLTKAMVAEMSARHPSCLALPDWLPAARARLEATGAARYAADTQPCLMELFALFARRALIACTSVRHAPRHDSAAPSASPLARAMVAAGSGHVVTACHATLDLDSLAAKLIELPDGRRSADRIAEDLLDDVRSGRLPAPAGINAKKWSEEKLRKRMHTTCRDLLARFARYGILE